MAKGHCVVVSASEPMGKFKEGVLSGIAKPGQCVWIKSVDTLGTITWEPYGATAAAGNDGIAADGGRSLIAVLREDELQGKGLDDAYADGDRCFVYCPTPGEELNMLYQNEAGTADDVVVGANLMVDDGTGKVMLADADPQAVPFQALEALTDPVADTHIWCIFTGY